MQPIFASSVTPILLAIALLLSTTPTAAAADEVLVGAGDIASCSYTRDSATAQLVQSISGTVFTTGDNVYPDGTHAQFADCYDPTWGLFKSRTRPTPGNHDYQTYKATAYRDYFGVPKWYAYDAGSWRIYALNSEVKTGRWSRQFAWLKADLVANPRQCVAAYWHRPVFSSGYHGNSTKMRRITRLLYNKGAELVIAGHDHDYERFAPMKWDGTLDTQRGIRHFVVGTGGAALYKFGTIKPNSEVRNNTTYGVLKLTLSASAYSWRFVPALGSFTDDGNGTCH